MKFFIQNTFIQVHFHPKTVSSKKNSHPKTVSSTNGFIQKHFHPKNGFIQKTVSSKKRANLTASPPGPLFPGTSSKLHPHSSSPGTPKISLFFPLPLHFSLFLRLSGRLLVVMGPSTWTTQIVRVGSMGSFCGGLAGCRGSHKTTPEKPKRTDWVVQGHNPRPQFHEKIFWREEKKRKMRREW